VPNRRGFQDLGSPAVVPALIGVPFWDTLLQGLLEITEWCMTCHLPECVDIPGAQTNMMARPGLIIGSC
jgi:hypothetical protein